MPIVNIAIIKGRTLEQKNEMVKSVTEAIASSINVQPEKIWIRIDEMEKENFATGGELHSEKN
jgi:4-oxalocrotonate tautomerase